MSRSYRKVPITKDGGPNRVKYAKKLANRKFRRLTLDEDFLYGKSNLYKRFFERYDIHDWILYYSKLDAINDWYSEDLNIDNRIYLHYKYKSLNDWLNNWYKRKIRK